MNKATFVNQLSQRAHLSKKQSKTVIEVYEQIIIETLKNGDSVCFPNFGSFKIVERKARVGYNPVFGKNVKYKAKRVPVFKSSIKFKNDVAK